MNFRIPFKHTRSFLKKLFILIFMVLLGSYFIMISKYQHKTKTKMSISNRETFYIKQTVLSSKESEPECSTYKFEPINPNLTHTSVPIYDFFVFHNELDILEIRLYENYNYVTLFLIAESSVTFSGKDKSLYLKENWSRFAKYHDKMRRIEVELPQNITGPWSNEHRMREEGLRLAQAIINHTKYILLSSDADEIPKARFMQALSHCLLPNPFLPLVLHCDFYYYSYEFRSRHHTLYGPSVNLIIVNQTSSISGNTLRNERFNFQFIRSTCFHCSWCFNQLKVVREKISSYSHTEHNKPQFHTREHILLRYRYGEDLFDRRDEKYIYIYNNTDLPQLVKAQSKRFNYMTNRLRLPNSGFIDASLYNDTKM